MAFAIELMVGILSGVIVSLLTNFVLAGLRETKLPSMLTSMVSRP
jgi:hypothetical protein